MIEPHKSIYPICPSLRETHKITYPIQYDPTCQAQDPPKQNPIPAPTELLSPPLPLVSATTTSANP